MPRKAPIDPYLDSTLDDVAADPLDWTDRFNTPLSPEEEKAFAEWLLKAKKAGDLRDYDLRGAWKAGVTGRGGHLPDTWKKPNHPTFSSESAYSGVDGFEGGSWRETAPKKWEYVPSETNIRLHGLDRLMDYFKRVEPSAVLRTPPR